MLYRSFIKTPIGEMVAIGNDLFLYLLDFADKTEGLSEKKYPFKIGDGRAKANLLIEDELNAYFEGKLRDFQTPLSLSGSPFQMAVWNELKKIPYGKTISYSEQARSMGHPKAFRAVANANGCNRFSIAIPCHRVIQANGHLGGYGGGLSRKKQLLEHEAKFSL